MAIFNKPACFFPALCYDSAMHVIDIHTHGIGGFDTASGSEEHILRMAEIQGESGVSAIIPTVYPADIDEMRRAMAAIRSAMHAQERGCGRGARILGLHLEGPFLNPAKAGSLERGSLRAPDEYAFEKLIDGFDDVVRIITIAPELQGAAVLIRKISDRGITVSMGHSNATYAEADAAYHAGARGITHIFNAMRGLHHREPGIAGFGLFHPAVYIEVIADPFHLNMEIIKMIFQIKNPDKIILVSDSVKQTRVTDDHEAVRNDRQVLLGGAMLLPASSERLIRAGISEQYVMNALSSNPDTYLKR